MNEELYHYGVKGMKWGVRRYQNYDGSRTAAGKKRYGSSPSSGSESKMSGGMVEQMAVYAAVYTAIFGGLAVAAKVSEKRMRKQKEEELEDLYENRQIKSFKDAPKLKKKMSAEDSAKETNPEFPSMGTTMNCTFCTTAMVLREKGYDVKATKLNDGWYSDDLFKKTFNSQEVHMKDARTRKDVTNKLGVHGDGAYGNLVVTWKLGGSHSIFWKNENGTTNFYDGQSGKAYRSLADKNMLLDNVIISGTKYNRLDNCEPTDYALAVVEPNKSK